MRGASLRARLFQAIGVVVIICVSLTIGLGLVLTRRAVEKATLQDVANQADIIAAIQSGASETISIPPGLQVSQHEKLWRSPTIVPLPERQGLTSTVHT